jgi:hypothetical protein
VTLNRKETMKTEYTEKNEEETKNNFPIQLKTNDEKDELMINSDKELEFYYFLLLNTCHDCFAETKYQKKNPKFQLQVFPEDIFKEDIKIKPFNHILDNPSFKKFREKFFPSGKKNVKTLLDDVPKKLFDSSINQNDHYIHNESNFNCFVLVILRLNKFKTKRIRSKYRKI